MLYKSLILEFCRNNENWKEILTSEPYHLKIKSDGDYYIFNYNQILSDFSLDICKEARGLIIDCDLNRVVCRSFNKFFNYGEKYAAEIDWPTARIQEKLDGSLIRLYYDCLNEDPCWTISTSGTIDAFDAELPDGGSFGCLFTRTFANMFRSHSEMDRMFANLNQYCTYVFELTTLDNRVVIRYPEPLVHHLSTFNNITGEELWDEDVFWEDDEGNVKTFLRPKRYYFMSKSLLDTLNMVKKFDSTHEGVVVADSKGNRIKIKTEEYVTMHRTVGGRAFTLEQAVDIIKLGKEDDLWMYPECVEKIWQVKDAIKYEINFLLNVLAWFRSHKYFELGRKEFAQAVSDFNMPNKSFERYVFMCYDGKFAIDKTDDFVYNDIMKKTSNNILKMLRLK